MVTEHQLDFDTIIATWELIEGPAPRAGQNLIVWMAKLETWAETNFGTNPAQLRRHALRGRPEPQRKRLNGALTMLFSSGMREKIAAEPYYRD